MRTSYAYRAGLKPASRLGLRKLKWADIDFDKGSLAVRRSVEQVKGQITFKQSKTSKGRRLISLPSLTVDALRKHRAEQAQERLLMGKGYKDQDWVFAQHDGNVWLPDLFTALFRRMVRKAKLGHI